MPIDQGPETSLGEKLKGEMERAYEMAPPSTVTAPTPRSRGFSTRIVLAGTVAGFIVVGGAVWLAADQNSENEFLEPTQSSSMSPTELRSPEPSATPSEGSKCPPDAPVRLPDGSDPGPVSISDDGAGNTRFTWGSGVNMVVQAPGQDVLGLRKDPSAFRIAGPGWEARMSLIGDEGVGEVAFVYGVSDCIYTVWLAPGTSLNAAADYVKTLY